MTLSEILKQTGYLQIALCVAALCVLIARKKWSEYWALGTFLAVRAASSVALQVILNRYARAGAHSAYRVYFYLYWSAFALESVLAVFILYSVYRETMAPLQGLQRIAARAFRRLALLCAAWILVTAFAPGVSAMRYLISAVSYLQRAQSMLALGLLLLLGLAIRYLGLSWRSTVFGVGLGLACSPRRTWRRAHGWPAIQR